MDWQPFLEKDESLVWEAKPAPRCYTFRHWRRSVLGLLLLTLAIYWEFVGLGLTSGFGPSVLGWFLLPLFAGGVWFSFGHLIIARREWENVYYAASERRLLVQHGLLRPRHVFLPLDAVSAYRLHPYGKDLAGVQIFGRPETSGLTLHCIEHPDKLTNLLDKAMAEHEPPDVALPPEETAQT